MLLPHISRWRLLSVRFETSLDQHIFFTPINFVSAENLRTLESCKYKSPKNWRNYDLERSLGSIFKYGAAPKLTCLRMERFGIKKILPLSSHPITVLQLDGAADMSWEALKHILRLPTLSSLSLSHADIVYFHTSRQPTLRPAFATSDTSIKGPCSAFGVF